VRKPDVFLIGGMKCGTTTLAHQLSLQPSVFVTDPKEPNFFSDEDQYARGMAWYEGLFAEAGEGDLLCEASTHYTKIPKHPLAAERVHAYAPEAKLIYMVRSPVSRSVSHVRHAWSERECGDDLDAALRQTDEFWQFSAYDMQLGAWTARYPQAKILVVALERLQTHRDEEFERVLRFLGVEGEWRDEEKAQNQGAERSRRLPLHDLVVDSPAATALRRALIPKGLRTFIRERRQLRQMEISEETRQLLADRVRDDTGRFGQRFGIDDLTPENFRERVLNRQLDFV
jgi:hypothetical protein